MYFCIIVSAVCMDVCNGNCNVDFAGMCGDATVADICIKSGNHRSGKNKCVDTPFLTLPCPLPPPLPPCQAILSMTMSKPDNHARGNITAIESRVMPR